MKCASCAGSSSLIGFVIFSFVLVGNVVGAFEGFRDRTGDILTYGPYPTGETSDSTYCRIVLERTERYNLPELAINRVHVTFVRRRMIGGIEWRSSGDKVYRENFASISYGTAYRRMRWMISGDLYRVDIRGYDGATTVGMGMLVEAEVWRDLYGCVGIDGMVAGRLRSGYRDIDRTGWGWLFWRVDDGTVLFGAIEIPSGSDTGLSLGLEEALSRELVIRLMLSDRPKRVGIGFDLCWLKPVIATFAVINTPPLGWSQRIVLRLQW